MRVLGMFALLVSVVVLIYYIATQKPFWGVADVPEVGVTTPLDTQEGRQQNQEGAANIPDVALEWKFVSIEDGVGDVMNPQTDVAVSFAYERGGKERRSGPHRLGSFTGSCNSYPESIMGEGYPGAAGYALCWFAGFGEELSAVVSESSITLYKRAVDEGSAEVSGNVGEWQKLFPVPLDS